MLTRMGVTRSFNERDALGAPTGAIEREVVSDEGPLTARTGRSLTSTFTSLRGFSCRSGGLMVLAVRPHWGHGVLMVHEPTDRRSRLEALESGEAGNTTHMVRRRERARSQQAQVSYLMLSQRSIA